MRPGHDVRLRPGGTGPGRHASGGRRGFVLRRRGGGYYYYYCEGDFKFTWRRNRTQQVTEHFKMDGNFGWYAVGGAAVHMGPVASFFAEIRYTDTETAFSDPGKYDLPEEGNSYDLGGFGALIGFMFKL